MNQSLNSIKYGDVFKLGNHLLLCGDARDKDLITKLVGTQKSKQWLWTLRTASPLPRVSRDFQALAKDKVITNDHIQSDVEYQKFSVDWMNAITPHLERKNSFYIFNADKMVFALRDGMLKAGLKFAQLLIWVKTHAVVGRLDYAPQHELIAYGWFGTHEFVKGKDKSVLVYPKPNKSSMHPTTKPIPLIRHLILNSTRVGDVVYDAFLGSGTTLLACEQTKRICLGVEFDPEYCQTIIDRFEKLSRIKAERYE